MLTSVEVTNIRVNAGRIEAVETSQGPVRTGLVIEAAGPWAATVGEMAGVRLPIQPIRRQMFTTTRLPELPRDFPFVIDFAQSLYFHLEGDGLLIGMSNQHESPGFDQNVDEDFELTNLEAAIQQVRHSMELCQQWGNIDQQAVCYVMLARLEHVQHQPGRAHEAMHLARQLVEEHHLLPRYSVWVKHALVRLWIAQGDLEQASRLVQQNGKPGWSPSARRRRASRGGGWSFWIRASFASSWLV